VYAPEDTPVLQVCAAEATPTLVFQVCAAVATPTPIF